MLADKILACALDGQSVLCVLNTISACKALYKKVFSASDQDVYCLNSYMLPKDREIVLKKLREPKSNRVRNKILISTQVVEAGVDLDFDVGFREQAPLSSIIQTAGRINREGRDIPGILYVVSKVSSLVMYEKTLQNSWQLFWQALPIAEEEILEWIEKYYAKIDISIEECGISEAITHFEFSKIDKINKEQFKLENNDYIESVVIGVDLKELAQEYWNQSRDLKAYEKKSCKKRVLEQFQDRIVNIKKKDLTQGVSPEFEETFGLYYFESEETVYSAQSGFLIEADKREEDIFF